MTSKDKFQGESLSGAGAKPDEAGEAAQANVARARPSLFGRSAKPGGDGEAAATLRRTGWVGEAAAPPPLATPPT